MDKVYSSFNPYVNTSDPVYSYCPISNQDNHGIEISTTGSNDKPVVPAEETTKNNEGMSSEKANLELCHRAHVVEHIVPIDRIVQVYQTTVTNSIKIQNSQIIHLIPTPQGPQENIIYRQTLQRSLPQTLSNVQIISQTLQPQQVMPTLENQSTERSRCNESTQSLPPQTSFRTQEMINTVLDPIQESYQQIQPTQPIQLDQSLHQQVPTEQESNRSQPDDLIRVNDVQEHVLEPRFYKQQDQVIQDQPAQLYYEYQTETFHKNPAQYADKKTGSDIQNASRNQIKCKTESANQLEITWEPSNDKRNRSKISNPNNWACNVRKVKHQRGEAYISRRGKYVPERSVRTTKDCLKSCKLKCSENINDTDREHIFRAFYSLNANEKKHFLLNTTERTYTKRISRQEIDEPRRKYCFKYFFLVRATRYTVCKNFYLGTLAISQKPVYNVHLGKSDVNTPKPDGRGLSEASVHSLPQELKDRVRKHIMSFRTVNSKSVKMKSKKKQFLDSKLSVKKMYLMYLNQCNNENVLPVKESMYRKIFSTEFNLHFKKVKTVLCDQCKTVITKK